MALETRSQYRRGIATGIVLLILAVTKFAEGAWIILVAMPLVVLLFWAIKRHYAYVAKNLSLQGLTPDQLRNPANVAIVPIGDIHRASLRAIKYALRLSDDVRVIQVVQSQEEAARTRRRWQQWEAVTGAAQLVIVTTEYRDILPPLVEYIRRVNNVEFPKALVTVVVPKFIPDSKLAAVLHNHTALGLRLLLRREEDVVVIDVPYHLRKEPAAP